jgi:hypothetical protein
VIGLKNKVLALVEDIISYIMIAMVWIWKQYGVQHKEFYVITKGVILGR